MKDLEADLENFNFDDFSDISSDDGDDDVSVSDSEGERSCSSKRSSLNRRKWSKSKKERGRNSLECDKEVNAFAQPRKRKLVIPPSGGHASMTSSHLAADDDDVTD